VKNSTKRLKQLTWLMPVALLCASAGLRADYSQHPAASAVIAQLHNNYGFEKQEVIGILREASTEQRILDSMANAAEKTKTWTAYKNSFVVPQRVTQGVAFYRKHGELLRAAEQKYGVPALVITSIMGIETNYGGYTGKANVLNALATLAFEHPSRSVFFSNELVQYIVLCREQGWQAETKLGSYAGAMGMTQFMPSNYRRLAVDGNNDGNVDLFEPADAIYSVANYLAHHGWKNGQPVTFQASLPADFDNKMIGRGLKPNHSYAQLSEAGVSVSVNLAPDTMARVVRFNDDDGDEAWLGLYNFYVISRYNPRAKYTMVVHLLSEAIASQI
jgi:membrane-bound lytic murein transglycosylase B